MGNTWRGLALDVHFSFIRLFTSLVEKVSTLLEAEYTQQ